MVNVFETYFIVRMFCTSMPMTPLSVMPRTTITVYHKDHIIGTDGGNWILVWDLEGPSPASRRHPFLQVSNIFYVSYYVLDAISLSSQLYYLVTTYVHTDHTLYHHNPCVYSYYNNNEMHISMHTQNIVPYDHLNTATYASFLLEGKSYVPPQLTGIYDSYMYQ